MSNPYKSRISGEMVVTANEYRQCIDIEIGETTVVPLKDNKNEMVVVEVQPNVNEEKKQETESIITKKKEASVLSKTSSEKLNIKVAEALVFGWHQIPIDEVMQQLKTNIKSGLTTDEAKLRILKYGENSLTPPKQVHPLTRFFLLLFSGFGPLLWIASILCFIAWRLPPPQAINMGLAVVLIIVIVFQAVFNWFQEEKSNKIMQSIQNIIPSKASVIRDNGTKQQVEAFLLTHGDIVELKIGEKIPADLRLFEVNNLKVDNSTLTGESEGVRLNINVSDEKNYLRARNLAFFGSMVIEGTAKGVVIGIGDKTALGTIAHLTIHSTKQNEQTNLHKEIQRFVYTIGTIAIGTAILALIAWGAWLRVAYPTYLNFDGILVNVIGLVVAYIPEGLPMCLTLTLTLIALRMQKENILVKNLPILETFNGISVIASDKTGTLTTNKMSVVHLVLKPSSDVSTALSYFDNEINDNANKNIANKDELLRIGILCNNAYLDEKSKLLVGDATDKAIYEFVEKEKKKEWQHDAQTYRNKYPQVTMIPFNSKNKFMATIRRDANNNGNHILFLKGAPELVLSRCNKMLNDKGNEIELTAELNSLWQQQQTIFSQKGERVIGLARLKLDNTIYNDSFKYVADSDTTLVNFPINNLCFVGMIGIIDPPKPGVAEAIQKCRRAHIRTIMVTGDHPITAEAIGRQITLISKSNQLDSLVIVKANDNVQNRKYIIYNKSENRILSKVKITEKVDTSVYTEKIIQNNDAQKKSIKPHSFLNIFSFCGGKNNNLQQNQYSKNDVDVDDVNDDDDDEDSESVSDKMQPQIVKSNSTNENEKIDEHRILINKNKRHKRQVREGWSLIIEGEQIDYMNGPVWDWVVTHDEIIFARTTPEHKLRIVKEFQIRDEIIAVTGDGVNDAPALKQSNLGIAMKSGSDVACGAAQMILLDNNFASIVKAIEYGRLVFDNLKKVILYLLPAGTWSEMLTVQANVFFGMPLPLSSFLMIIISVLTDVGPSMSLIYEYAESNIMERKPYHPSRHHLTDLKLIFFAYFQMGMVESFAAFFMYFYYMSDNGIKPGDLVFAFNKWNNPNGYCGKTPNELNELLYTSQSIYFFTLVIAQFGNVFSIRTRTLSLFQHPPIFNSSGHNNYKIFYAVIFSFCASIFITYLPFFNSFFYTRPVPWKYIGMAFIFPIIVFIYDETRKWLIRRYPKSLLAKIAW